MFMFADTIQLIEKNYKPRTRIKQQMIVYDGEIYVCGNEKGKNVNCVEKY